MEQYTETSKAIRQDTRLTLSGEEKFFGPGIAMLLHYIEKTGSIQAACAEMDMSYSKAWKILRRADRELGFSLIESKNGGKTGGESRLTEEGGRFLRSYDEMNAKLKAYAGELLSEYFPESGSSLKP